MGYRTVVLLKNDLQHQWAKDPELGHKIATSAVYAMGSSSSARAELSYGRVIENCHTSQETLVMISGSNVLPLAYGLRSQEQGDSEMCLELLRTAAKKLGYRLVKNLEVVK